MGTTLTGTTPQDTYDSLIKVTDNGPLSGTAKFLSDGLGNDSVLALSTARVGINTSSPDVNLHISGDVNGRAALRLASTAANRLAAISFYGNNVESAIIGYEGGSEIVGGGVQGDLIIRNVLSGKDIILDTNAGNVGIGTLAPSNKLTVKGTVTLFNDEVSAGYATLDIVPATAIGASANRIAALNTTDIAFETSGAERFRITNNGVTFNGDTAAANALDDYEEGTFTMTATPNSSGSITLNPNTCSYTKIGRQVTIRGNVVVGSVSSPVGTLVILGGLPFTSLNSVSSRGVGTAMYFPTVGTPLAPINYQLSNAVEWNLILTASSLVAGDEFYISLTYFV